MGCCQYKSFVFPQGPERLEVHSIRAPRYETAPNGTLTYRGLGPLCREIRGNGVFHGMKAAQQYRELASHLQDSVAGDLVLPVQGRINALLLELRMEQESREDYVVYSFRFREADPSGAIPPITEHRS